MKLERPLIFLDLESTGVSPATDRIVQIGLVELHPSGHREAWDVLVNPGCPIPPGASAVHQITDDMVKDCPPFSFYAHTILAFLARKDLAGFGIFQFDLPCLYEEFDRAGIVWDTEGMRFIDCGNIFKFKEPRTLQDAYRRYADGQLSGCWHNALTDAKATLAVLQGQLAAYPDLAAMSLDELATFSRGDSQRIDFAGKLVRDKDGDAVWNFGRAKGLKLRDELGLADWLLARDFPAETKMRVQQEIDRLQAEAEVEAAERAENSDIPY